MFITVSSRKRVNVNNIISYQDTDRGSSMGSKFSYGITFIYKDTTNSSSYGSGTREESLWFSTKEERDAKLKKIDELFDLREV